jgi:hypothetical protein
MVRISKLACAVAGALLLAGCATHPAGPISAKQLRYARSFKLFTVYWAGRSIDGIPLTQADGAGDYDPVIGITMYYGNCERGGGIPIGGCTLPLKVTTVRYVPHSNVSLGPRRDVTLRGVPAVIFDKGSEIELYTDEMEVDVVGDTPRRALQAVAHLTTFNRTPTATWPAFPKPQFKPGVSLKQIAEAKEATGDTGTLAPPSALQPSVNATQ